VSGFPPAFQGPVLDGGLRTNVWRYEEPASPSVAPSSFGVLLPAGVLLTKCSRRQAAMAAASASAESAATAAGVFAAAAALCCRYNPHKNTWAPGPPTLKTYVNHNFDCSFSTTQGIVMIGGQALREYSWDVFNNQVRPGIRSLSACLVRSS
jgi:hypothetical protein